jgi:predicted DNA-binding protein
LIAALCVCGVGCRQLSLDNPKPPETAALQERYDSPPGHLTMPDLDTVTETVMAQTEVIAETEDFSLAQNVLDEVSAKQEVVENGEEIDTTKNARLLAVANVKRICRGPEGDDVIDEAQFGSLTMTIKASPRGIFPVVWGRFDRCIDHSPMGELEIDGDYFIAFRHEGTSVRSLLVSFTGSIRSERVDFSGALDFRIRDDKRVELRAQATDGDVIVGVSRQGQLLVRERDRQWECDPVARRCTDQDTQEVLEESRE